MTSVSPEQPVIIADGFGGGLFILLVLGGLIWIIFFRVKKDGQSWKCPKCGRLLGKLFRPRSEFDDCFNCGYEGDMIAFDDDVTRAELRKDYTERSVRQWGCISIVLWILGIGWFPAACNWVVDRYVYSLRDSTELYVGFWSFFLFIYIVCGSKYFANKK